MLFAVGVGRSAQASGVVITLGALVRAIALRAIAAPPRRVGIAAFAVLAAGRLAIAPATIFLMSKCVRGLVIVLKIHTFTII